MAVYSTFFLSEPAQLLRAFPSWKPPLATPVTRIVTNPFTRKETTITSREPNWDDFDPENMEMPEYQVVPIEGDYAAYLENRIPPFVRSQPHLCLKGLTNIELEPLVNTVVEAGDRKLTPPLYAPPSINKYMFVFPNDFVVALLNSSDAALRGIAERWAAERSMPKHTHSVSGKRNNEDWTTDDAMSLLKPIAALAKQQRAGQEMYLILEW